MFDSRDRSTRVRAAVAASIVAATSVAARPTVRAVAAVLLAIALAVFVRPALADRWETNVALGIAIAVYGVASALSFATVPARAGAVLLIVLGVLVAVNHLGIAPWSTHPRRV